MRCAFKSFLLLCALFPVVTLAQNVNCPPVDDSNRPLTGSARNDGDSTHSCTYAGAGQCQYFSDGTFSSGSSECPEGLPDQGGAPPASIPPTQGPPPPPATPTPTETSPTLAPPPATTPTPTPTTPVISTPSTTSTPTTTITVTPTTSSSSSSTVSSSTATSASSSPAAPSPTNAAAALTGRPALMVMGVVGMVAGIHLL